MLTVSSTVSFPVYSFRRIPTPYDDDGKFQYIAVVEIKNVSEKLNEWREINVRDPKEEAKVPRYIRESLIDAPKAFYFKSHGMLLIGEKVVYNNQTNMVDITFTEKATNGLADGGHNYRVIRSVIESLSEGERNEKEGHVRFEILSGFTPEEVVGIVDARNKSTPVLEQSILELSHAFKDIKDSIKGRSYAKRVHYKQYEEPEDGVEKDVDVKELLTYLACFDSDYFDAKRHPIIAYSSAGAVIKHFKDRQKEFAKIAHLLPEILELRDTIYAKIPEVYKASKEGGRFGSLKGVDTLDNPVHELVFTGEMSKYDIPKGFIYPILAAFRVLVKHKGDRYEWKKKPMDVFPDVAEELATTIVEQAKSVNNPTALGKDAGTWKLCYYILERAARDL